MSRSQWVIDQLEGAWATLSPVSGEGETWALPATLLPEGLKEGDALNLTLSPAPELSEALHAQVKAQVEALTSEDDGGDFSI